MRMFYRTREAAKELGVGQATVRIYVKEEKLEAVWPNGEGRKPMLVRGESLKKMNSERKSER